MSEPKGSISLTNPDGDDMTLSFLWRANDEILLQEFHMVLYSEEKLRSLQSLPKVSLNDRKKVLKFVSEYDKFLTEEFKSSIGNTGDPLTQKVLLSLGYCPFYDFNKLQEELKKFSRDKEIKKIGAKMAEWNDLFLVFE